MVLLEPSDVTDEIDEALEREQRQEMERLLYVALTRAQHTLVLAFDENLFAKTSGEIHSHSQSKWLKAARTQVNMTAFADIGGEPNGCAMTAEHQRRKAGASAAKIDIRFPADKIDKASAVRRSSAFVQKLNPSGLPLEEPAGLPDIQYAAAERPRSTGPALQYGLWWHHFVQELNWNDKIDSWNRIFDRQKNISPDPARSEREWKLLLKHLSGAESFRRAFSEKYLPHSEMPFFWKLGSNRCVEGVIDLAFFERENGKCLILDWKTDRVPPDNTETLHARYRPQLAAYWKALSEITKRDVEAAIYSTAAGAPVRYTTDELSREWARLEALSPLRFDIEVLGSEVSPPPPAAATPTKPVQLEFVEL